jgi:hypothetical protein
MRGRFDTSVNAAFTAEFNGRSARTREPRNKPSSIESQRLTKKSRPKIALAEVVVEGVPHNIRVAKGGLRDRER